jgi:hypothetical protein
VCSTVRGGNSERNCTLGVDREEGECMAPRTLAHVLQIHRYDDIRLAQLRVTVLGLQTCATVQATKMKGGTSIWGQQQREGTCPIVHARGAADEFAKTADMCSGVGSGPTRNRGWGGLSGK